MNPETLTALQGMAPPPRYKRGSGQGSLPQGEASQLNQATSQVPSAAVEPAPLPPGPTAGQNVAPAAEAPFRPMNDRQKFLVTPDTPGEPGFPPSVPQGIDEWAQAIARAAELPGASDSLRELNRAIAAHLGPM